MDVFAFLLALVVLVLVVRQSYRIAALEDALRTAALPRAIPETSAAASAVSSSPAVPTSDADRLAEIQAAAAERAASAPPPPPYPGRVAAAAPPVRPAPRITEALLGTRISVWVGALLLAFGGVFLVRYSIEQGVFGPGFRILMGLAFGAGLLAAGEVLRRRAPASRRIKGVPNIPALLTGVGTLSLFAAIYAASAVYAFLPGIVGFVLLAVIGTGTMALGLLHGQGLAGLGLVAALTVPVLTAGEPNLWAAAAYVPIVALLAHLFARARSWGRLALSATSGVVLWTMLLLLASPRSLAPTLLAFCGYGLAMVGVLSRPRFLDLRRLILTIPSSPLGSAARVHIDEGVLLAQGACLLLAIGLAADQMSIVTFIVLATLAVALPVSVGRLVPGIAVFEGLATATVLAMLVAWPRGGLLAPALKAPLLYLPWGTAVTIVLVAVSLRRVFEPRSWPLPAALAAAMQVGFLPPVALAIALVRSTEGEVSLFAGGAALVAALGYLPLLRCLNGVVLARPDAGNRLVIAAAISGALACVVLAWTFLFEGTTLTTALALSAAATSRIAMLYRVSVLRYAVVVLASAVVVRVAADPLLVAYGLGTTPILNGLLVVYGVPALAFLYAGYVLGGPEDRQDVPVITLQSLGLLMTAALTALEIRHATHGGSLRGGATGFLELGLDVSVVFAGAILLLRLARSTATPFYGLAGLVAVWTGVAVAGIGLGFLFNPFLDGGVVRGSLLFNDLLAGYVLPALVAFALARVVARDGFPGLLVPVRFAALGLAYLAVTLWTRFAFTGADIAYVYGVSQAELYAHSAVWILLGLGFLAYGLRFQSWPARAVGFMLLFGTVGKVFLIDMAGLSGLLRAVSFIGLGVVLIAVGFYYQRRY